MSFDCIITVKGNGKGRYGNFKQDKTGPVSQFMVDNVHLYPIVKAHIVACDRCDPTEALRFYLNRRAGGVTVTGTLAKLALSYERLCRKTRPIPKELVNEFICRSADFGLIAKHEARLNIRELVAAAELYLKATAPWRDRALPFSESMFGRVCKLADNGGFPETDEEMEDLVSVMEVQIV